jgi:hypothetical protein
MPHYSYEYTFEEGHSAETPETLEMPCAWGKLTNMNISFPAGCHGVTHVHIDQELHQIFPTNAEADYALDDYTLLITDEYDLIESTRKIYLRGWNEGCYPHKISVSFTVIPFERMTPAEQAILQILQVLQRIFRIKVV